MAPYEYDRRTLAKMSVPHLHRHGADHLRAAGCVTLYVDTVARYLSSMTGHTHDGIIRSLTDAAAS